MLRCDRGLLAAVGFAFTACVLGLLPTSAEANRQIRDDWRTRYGAVSSSYDNAGCALCHADANGGPEWNAYGWDIRDALIDPACDLNGDGVSHAEAFYCVEPLNSDRDGSNELKLFPSGDEVGLEAPQMAWSPNGDQLVIAHKGNLYRLDLGGQLRQLTADGESGHPRWSR